MKRAFASLLALAAFISPAAARQPDNPPPAPPPPRQPDPAPNPDAPQEAKLVFVKMETSMGDIFIELNQEKAPITVKNFLAYTDRNAYDGTVFHRVVPGFVIQGGGYNAELDEQKSGAPIKNEWQNGLKNLRGTIAMARDTEPDTATREFFFNLKDNPQLDSARPLTGNAGYAVFGRVSAGMDVIDRIKDVPLTARPDKGLDQPSVPRNPVLIIRVSRAKPEDAKAAADAETARQKAEEKPPLPPGNAK